GLGTKAGSGTRRPGRNKQKGGKGPRDHPGHQVHRKWVEDSLNMPALPRGTKDDDPLETLEPPSLRMRLEPVFFCGACTGKSNMRNEPVRKPESKGHSPMLTLQED
ncbi:hypothetical protein PanWU01x14_104690, partial [Parasponia andersonii]